MSKLANIDTIQVGRRQRRKMSQEKLDTLKASIRDKGLLHPIVCALEFEFDILRLVAGERRLLAIRQLAAEGQLFNCDGQVIAPGQIPYILITDLDDIQLREAELEENILREDLTWQDRTAAIDELHKLRKAQNPKHTVLDTARELNKNEGEPGGRQQDIVARASVVAEHLDDPDVSRAKNEREAFKIVSRKIEGEFRKIMQERGLVKKSPHTLTQGDLCVELGKLTPEYFTCIIADPPYGIGADKFGDAAKLAHLYKDDAALADSIDYAIAFQGYLAAAPNAHLYIFCDVDRFSQLKLVVDEAGWTVWRTPLIWEKGSMGHAPIGELGWRRTYEMILFATKGGKSFGNLYNDVIHVAAVKDKVYAAQKPVELYKILLDRSCYGGQRVLDPCCGCGTVFRAATKLGLVAHGIELSDEGYELSLAAVQGDDDETPDI